MRFTFAHTCSALLLAATVYSAGLASPGQAQSDFQWKNVNIQGMGYVTGMVIHPDVSHAPNRIYVRTDVGGAYRFDAVTQRWIALFDAFGPSQQNIFGVESLALDPNAPADLYAATNGGIWVSHDLGDHWTDTGLQDVYMGANDPFRGSSGERLLVDPCRSGRLFFGSRRDGLWLREPTGGWSHVDGLPRMPCVKQDNGACTDVGVTFVVADPNRGECGPGVCHLYVGLYGDGVWASEDGGMSWHRLSADADPLRAAVAADGTLYVTFGGGEEAYAGPGAVRRYRAGKWQDITPGSKEASYSGVSVMASHPRVVMVTSNLAQIYRSTDGGDHWTSVDVAYSQQPAYYWTKEWFRWGTAALVIDPNEFAGARVWKTDGFGVSRTEDAAAPEIHWTTVMGGLEELVVNVVKAPSGSGTPEIVTGVADAMGFVHTDVTSVPAQKLAPDHTAVSMVTSIDYSARVPNTIVYVGLDETNPSVSLTGISRDSGKTWKPFGSTAPGRGGIIAVSATNPRNMVWSPTSGIGSVPTAVQFTRDGGETWSVSEGLPTGSFYRTSQWWNGQALSADKIDGQRFYYLFQGQDGTVGFWASRDGGATWSRTATIAGAPAWNVCPMVKVNPDIAGDIWLTFCPNVSKGTGSALYHSVNGGATFVEVSGVAQAHDVTFGKGDKNGRPWVYIFGRVSGSEGDAIWRSKDYGASWTRVSDPEKQQFGTLRYLEGDLRTRNRIYIGTSGRGVMVGDGRK